MDSSTFFMYLRYEKQHRDEEAEYYKKEQDKVKRAENSQKNQDIMAKLASQY